MHSPVAAAVPVVVIFFAATISAVSAFAPQQQGVNRFHAATVITQTQQLKESRLHVSIGLGPSEEEVDTADVALVEGVDYVVPIHDDFRTSRRGTLDAACDAWYGDLLEGSPDGILTTAAANARSMLTTPVPLVNDIELPPDHEEWTPYVTTKLPWSLLSPAFGLEQYGLPIPRRNAETWRQFDVAGMVGTDYSGTADFNPSSISLDDIQTQLVERGGWLDNDQCAARLVYVNGMYVDALSKATDTAYNLVRPDETQSAYLSRLTDGFTDELAAPVANGNSHLTSFQRLSGPNHCMGAPTTQFAINTQQGTACFAALNTIKTKSVAYVCGPKTAPRDDLDTAVFPKPVLIVNAVTPSGGGSTSTDTGVSFHPRTLVVAEDYARLSIVQSIVDLNDSHENTGAAHKAKLYNGYTQFFVATGANVTHSYLEESGGVVTAGVEVNTEDDSQEALSPRKIESARPELQDTHLETIDVQLLGESSTYKGTVMSIGGSGRVRIAMGATLLHSDSQVTLNGFSLSGGNQRTDMKTNIHHIAQGTRSNQVQKNMIGGRAIGSFRGRIRVEQSAQQTDSHQLARTVLLSDRARAWAVPSLEIIADDVQCAHGSTVSDLSEEELFYLRSRGLDRSMARNLLMFAFAGDISAAVDPAMLGNVDSKNGLQQRVIRRLENVVPQGERAVRGEFQSV
jgi:Fe-S cluster assembly protein SufD